jgi:AcrR family transcriptional regulator
LENFQISVDPTDRSGYTFAMPEKNAKPSKRDELVDIASSLFYRQGYGATGIKQIIDTAGIAKGTFYSHFDSKEEVGLAWLKNRHTVWNSWLNERLDATKSAKGSLLALFDFLESWMTECEFRGCAFLNTMAEVPAPEHAMRREILAHKEGLQAKIQALAVAHFKDKPAAFGRHKGTIIFLLFEGALIETQNFRDASPIISAKKEVRELLTA